MRPEKLEYVYILNKDLTYMKKYGKSFKNLVLVRIFLDSYDFFLLKFVRILLYIFLKLILNQN